jgi:HEAT repeat protein
MRYNIFILSIVMASSLLAKMPAPSSLELSQKRIKDHLLIRDYQTALSELKIYLAQFPQSRELHGLMVRALAESGCGLEAFAYWKYAFSLHQEIKEDTSLIESIAWAILEKAEGSSQQIVNISSIIGAALTRDAKAVKILRNYLHCSNAYLRMIAVKLSMQYGDKTLIKDIQTMLKKETVWYVRLEIIRALGRFGLKEATPLLKEMVANPRSTLEERSVAAEALITLYEKLEDQELNNFFQSKRAGLRYLACEIVSYLNLREKSEQVSALLTDTSPDVKMGALNTLSVVGLDPSTKDKVITLVEALAQDTHSHVAMTACRLLMFYKPQIAGPLLEKWIHHENADLRRMAACAVALSGPEGRKLGLRLLSSVEDPFVKVNLAYGMLGQEQQEPLLCKHLAEFLGSYSDKIMIDTTMNPLFKVLSPSRIKHIPEMAQYPTAIDQYTRLHLLNILAMMRYPHVEESIKKYLKAQSFGMTYTASTSLIEEGAEDSIEIIRSLLSDEDQLIRVQAALVLALVGGEHNAVHVLQEAYPKMDREIKMHILEAIGHIGSKESIPFLMELFEDPFNVMRIIAASSIIQCIYH